MTSTDEMIGGKSEASAEVIDGALRVSGEVVSGAAYPWAGAMFLTGKEQFQPANLSSKSGVRFRVRADGRPGLLMVFSQSLGRIPATKSFPTTSEWTTVSIPWSDLGGIDGSDIQGFLITAGQVPGRFEIFIDDVVVFD